MKITLEIPDTTLRRAKSIAVGRGIALSAFVVEALVEKLANASATGGKPWVKLAGGLQHLHKETMRIDGIMKRGFEEIEPEDWE